MSVTSGYTYTYEGVNVNENSKKLYLAALYAKNDDGVVVEVETPKWVVETSEDRAKTYILSGKLDDKLNWNVRIIQTINF